GSQPAGRTGHDRQVQDGGELPALRGIVRRRISSHPADHAAVLLAPALLRARHARLGDEVAHEVTEDGVHGTGGERTMRVGVDGRKIPRAKEYGPFKSFKHGQEHGMEELFFRNVLEMSPTLDHGELREMKADADRLG